jgi:SpoIID/LytB domain protein
MQARKLFAVIFVAVSLVVLPASGGQAQTASSFTFYGAGFGHGIGMSQWGAYGLALKGWTHQQILTHYYTGTTVAQKQQPARIRVGLVDGVGSVHLAALKAPVQLQTGSPGPSGTVVATIPAGSSDLVKAGTAGYEIYDSQGAQVGTTVDGTQNLYAAYQGAHAMVRSVEAGHTYNRGFIELNDYRPCTACNSSLRMIAVLNPQSYLYGLGEVPSSWPAEAMQAQADAARTYADYLIDALGQNRVGCNCGVYDDTRNQVYAGWDHEGEYDGAKWVQAVNATPGEVVLYQGKVIDAQYMSSSGGYTEDNENVWGGSPIPYLRGVCDPGDYNTANPAKTWTRTFTADETTAKLRSYTGEIGAVQGFGNISRGVSGRILTVTVVGSSGTKQIAGSSLRSALGLMDDRVWINNDKLVTGSIRLRYDSVGCHPGLPTTPQTQLNGGYVQRFSDGAIYQNSQRSRTVWLYGDMYTKYQQLQEGAGPIGLPMTKIVALQAVSDCAQQTCQKAQFDSGFIFFKTDVGAHELHGYVLQHYLSQSGVSGHLGFPTSDVTQNSDGSTQATFQGTPGGAVIVVTCSSDGSSCSESQGSKRH